MTAKTRRYHWPWVSRKRLEEAEEYIRALEKHIDRESLSPVVGFARFTRIKSWDGQATVGKTRTR